jgi:hypothetical protein
MIDRTAQRTFAIHPLLSEIHHLNVLTVFQSAIFPHRYVFLWFCFLRVPTLYACLLFLPIASILPTVLRFTFDAIFLLSPTFTIVGVLN